MLSEANSKLDWCRYPHVAQNTLARSLLLIEEAFGRASNTLDAYARGREEFLSFCTNQNVAPELATKEHLALWVRDLTSRPHKRGGNVKNIDSGAGLANATIHQRVTAVRLFFDYSIEKGIRNDNPVGRGRYTPGKGFAGSRERGLIHRYKKLPWIPNDEQWGIIVQAINTTSLRSRVMFTLSYDSALRREEVCSLHINDFDFAHRLLTVRAEITKGRRARVIHFSALTATLLSAYLRHRRKLRLTIGNIFLSESRRNFAEPLTFWTWSKEINRLAKDTGIVRFTPHTLRHLCLTDLARSGWDLHEIAEFAGHRHTDTTMDYIHLSGRDLARKFERGMSMIHQRRLETLAAEDIF